MLALKLSEYWNFYLGDCRGMREVQARIAPHWDESVPDHGKVLGMSAFALEECGAYDEAERRGRRAVEIDPTDIWATHAVAHVMEMTGRQRDGIAWIEGKAADFGGCNAFANHLWWHRALFYFELGQFDAVLDLYDREVLPPDAFEYLDICNAVSILWRLEEEGVDVGDRWERVADAAAERAEDLQLVFTDVHYAMAFAAAGRKEALDALIAGAESFVQDTQGTQAGIMAEHGLALCRAAAAARAEDWGRAVDLLYPRRRGIVAIGGSHAQRDLFRRALIHAAENAGRDRLAASLLAERCEEKSTSPIALRRYARVLSALGDTASGGGRFRKSRLVSSIAFGDPDERREERYRNRRRERHRAGLRARPRGRRASRAGARSRARMRSTPHTRERATRWYRSHATSPDAEDCERAVDTAVERFGRLDAMIHFAAIHSSAPWRDLGAVEFNRVLAVNVTGSFLMSQAAAKPMIEQGGGSIVLTASGIVHVGGAGGDGRGGPAYASSKAAIVALTRSLARSLGADGIRVNAIAPGSTETAMTAGYTEQARADAAEPRRTRADGSAGGNRGRRPFSDFRTRELHHRRGDERQRRRQLRLNEARLKSGRPCRGYGRSRCPVPRRGRQPVAR